MKKFILLFTAIILFTGCNLPKPRTPQTDGLTTTSTLKEENGVTIVSSRTYDLAFEVKLTNNGSGTASQIRLVVALVSDREPFQKVLSMKVSHDYTLETDDFDNHYAVFEFTDFASGQESIVRFEYRVQVNALSFNLGNCQGDLRYTDTYAEPYLEVNAPEIVAQAQSLAQNKVTLCEIARADYDFAGDTVTYAGYNPGEVGALQALKDRSGDCTEFSDLTTALLRAEGIPALPVEGVTCCTQGAEYSAGDTKHNWVLANLPGQNWVPLDPTWGRFENQREAFFAAIDDQHIIVTVGRNPAPLNSYHGFTYTWWGDNVVIDNDEDWSIVEVVN